MALLYSIGVYFYGLGIRIAALFSGKAKKWITGRQQLFEELAGKVNQSDQWIWFHAASLGEFEQGRPLIDKMRLEHPEMRILLTFFSPSGYEVRKNYQGADIVCYMPLDTRANARRFVQIVNPILVVFVKYELWFHHLKELQRRNIPTLLISAQFRPGQFYFRSIGSFFKPVLEGLKRIFVADRASLEVLRDKGYKNAELAGDTRIDRVIETSISHNDFTKLQQVLGSDRILVVGSSWPLDESIVIPFLNRGDIKGIIAPHEVHEEHLAAIESKLTVDHCRISQLNDKSYADVIIVDTIGDLAHIYHLASIAYVGGGFGKGIHNILEAAVYGIPVIFGPNHQQFAEAQELLSLNVASSISTQEEFVRAFEKMTDPNIQGEVRQALEGFFKKHEGATARIYDYICRSILIDNELEK